MRTVEAALLDAAPFAALPVLVGQVPYLNVESAVDLLRRVVRDVHPLTWEFTDERMKAWAPEAADFAMEQVRALPPGAERIQIMCGLPARLSRSEKRETLDGILDGTFPNETPQHTKPMSYADVIARFVRTLPVEWREEWIAAQASNKESSIGMLLEHIARRDVERLTEHAIRSMWARTDHKGGFFSRFFPLPGNYFWLVPLLPDDLRSAALKRIRRSTDRSDRLSCLAFLDEDLTEVERREVVLEGTSAKEPSMQIHHLRKVKQHLPKVAYEIRRRWLELALAIEVPYHREAGLMLLLPSLTPEDRRRVEETVVLSALENGECHVSRWDLLSDAAFAPILSRLRDDAYGWSRDAAIRHLVEHRDATLVEECLLPLIESLSSLPGESCLEIVHAMTPWLAKVTDGALPKALSALPVPKAPQVANPLYVIKRVIDASNLEDIR